MIDEQGLMRTILAEQVKALAYIQSIVRRQDVADDVFQDVCALAVEKRSQIQDDAHLRRWLRTTARLVSMNVVRRRRTDHLLLDEAALDAVEQSWREQDGVDASAHAEALRQCLPLLSERHRALVSKRFVDQYDYPRLASECNRTVASLYVTFSRIYTFLAQCIVDRIAVDLSSSGTTPAWRTT